MRLTKNLIRREFACKCGCGFNAADIELATLVQGAADHFKKEYKADLVFVLVTSGNRCASHNINEGGAPSSQHILGTAVDHKIKVQTNGDIFTVTAKKLSDYYNNLHTEKLGIGMYPRGRVHLDVRASPTRWDNR